MAPPMTTLHLIEQLTNDAFPASNGDQIRVNQMQTHLTWEHDTFTYNSLWPGGESLPLTLRSYRHGLTYWQTNDPYKVDRVWAVLRRLRLDSFPSPRPLARGQIENTAYVIWHQEVDRYWNPPEDDLERYARPFIPQLAELLARLHRLDHNGLNDEPLYQATVAGTLVRMLLWSREIESPALRSFISRLKPAVARVKGWRPRLIHGNPHLYNALIDNDRITGLGNWEHAAIGDPRWDVMTAAHWLRRQNAAMADQFVNWYETFAGQSIDRRPFWYALISTRLWALKCWLAHAIEQDLIADDAQVWTEDLDLIRAEAEMDLAAAGL